MKVKELRALSIPDLQKRLKDSRTELFNLRFQMATGQLQNHRQIRHVRRNLAQILTEIHLKDMEGDSSPTVGDSGKGAVDEVKPEPSQKARKRSGSAEEKS